MVQFVDGKLDSNICWGNPPCHIFLVTNLIKMFYSRIYLVSSDISYPNFWSAFFVPLLIDPVDAELSVIIGVLSCLCSNSSNVTLIGTDSCELLNKAPHSASAALAHTCFSNQHLMWTAALCIAFNQRVFLAYKIKRSSLQYDYAIRMLQDSLHRHVPVVICHWFHIKWLLVYVNWDNWAVGSPLF